MWRVCIAIILYYTSATAALACEGILELTRSKNLEYSGSDIAGELHKNYCNGRSLTAGSNFNFGVEAMIKKLPISLNIGGGSTQQKMQQLCYQYEDWYSQNSKQIRIEERTPDKAFATYLACKEAVAVKFSVEPKAEVVGFGVKRGTDPIEFYGMDYDPDLVTCTGPVGERSQEVTIDANTRFMITDSREIPITCRRKYKKTAGGDRYLPATEIAIKAQGSKPLIVPLPTDERYEPSLASEIKQMLADAQEQIRSLQADLKGERARAEQYVRVNDSVHFRGHTMKYIFDGGDRPRREQWVTMERKQPRTKFVIERE